MVANCVRPIRKTSKPLAAVDSEHADHHKSCLIDEIRFVKFSLISLPHDSKGFFYQRHAHIHPFGRSNGSDPLSDSDSQPANPTDLPLKTRQAGTETTGDKDAMLYYHRVGTLQYQSVHN